MNTRSFFASLCQKLFYWRTSREIIDKIFPHLEHEKDFGYSFQSDEEMNAETKRLDARILLDAVESQARKMPSGERDAFLYVMHRDLHWRLRHYVNVAKRRSCPKRIDPRLVATHA